MTCIIFFYYFCLFFFCRFHLLLGIFFFFSAVCLFLNYFIFKTHYGSKLWESVIHNPVCHLHLWLSAVTLTASQTWRCVILTELCKMFEHVITCLNDDCIIEFIICTCLLQYSFSSKKKIPTFAQVFSHFSPSILPEICKFAIIFCGVFFFLFWHNGIVCIYCMICSVWLL